MNYRDDIGELYENYIINEVAGALNYWLSPDAQLIKVDNHEYYAMSNFNLPESNESVYDSAGKMGYIRVVEESSNVYFTYNMSRKPDKKQFNVLMDLANDKNKNLIDGETQKVIIQNNNESSDSVSSGNQQVKQMDTDLQPSYYNKRNTWGESYEDRFALNDYTKLIEESSEV